MERKEFASFLPVPGAPQEQSSLLKGMKLTLMVFV